MGGAPPPPDLRGFTPPVTREGQILKSLLNGVSNKMIARELGISEATVKVHLNALMRKVNAQNRTQAAVWGIANGFGEETPPALPISR